MAQVASSMTTTETVTYDGVTRGYIPIRLGNIDGPLIGEVVSFYSDGDNLMANCLLDGKQETIRLTEEGKGTAASYVTATGVPYLNEGPAISYTTTGKVVQTSNEI